MAECYADIWGFTDNHATHPPSAGANRVQLASLLALARAKKAEAGRQQWQSCPTPSARCSSALARPHEGQAGGHRAEMRELDETSEVVVWAAIGSQEVTQKAMAKLFLVEGI